MALAILANGVLRIAVPQCETLKCSVLNQERRCHHTEEGRRERRNVGRNVRRREGRKKGGGRKEGRKV
jgi:hypothetical protein